MSRILILNPPTSNNNYLNRDQMGGMGQNISFGKSPLVIFLRKLKSEFIRQPVLKLVYAATILSTKHQVKVIDALNQNLSFNELIKEVEKFKPEYSVMAISSSEIFFEKKVAQSIKALGSKIITVGDAIPNKPDLFDNSFDVSIEGEVEPIIEKLIEGKITSVPGIIYHKNGKVKRNPTKELLTRKDLNSLPFPKWDLFPYEKYRYYPLLLKEPIVSMLSSRGCPYGCYYCSYSKNEGKSWRARSPENVVSEMINTKKYGVLGIVFRDPLFSASPERTKEICRLLIQKKVGVIWACETRPELLTPNLLEIMKKAGCRAINLGIESINENELKNVGRSKVNTLHLKELLKHAKKLGINTTGFFILGLPGATKESMNKTLKFSREIGLSHAEYKVATPYPGTKLYEMAIKNNWIIKFDEWGGYNSTMQINKDIGPEYLNQLCDSAFKNFYYSPKRIVEELKKDFLIKGVILLKSTLRAIKNNQF